MLQRFELGVPIHGMRALPKRPDLLLLLLSEGDSDASTAEPELKLRTAQLENRGGRITGVKLLPPPKKRGSKAAKRAAAASAGQLESTAALPGATAAATAATSLLAKRVAVDSPVAATTIGGAPFYAARARADGREVRVCHGLSGETQAVKAGADVTAIALGPDELSVALGDADGVITVWLLGAVSTTDNAGSAAEGAAALSVPARNDGGFTGAARSVARHWHASAVGALAYTPDGAQLLSAGAECALVVWRARGAPSERRIVPRLGAAVVGLAVSPDGGSYALACADNAVRIMSAVSLEVVALCRGLQPAAAAGHALAYSSLRSELVLPVRNAPGTLQFWALNSARHSRELVVVPGNAGAGAPTLQSSKHTNSKTRRGGPQGANAQGGGAVCFVKFVAFTADCDALVTVESRPEAELAAVESLKFWTASDILVGAAGLSGWKLHTRVDTPHERGVTAVACSPAPGVRLAATTSRDGTFKLWEKPCVPTFSSPGLGGSTGKVGEEEAEGGWVCLAVGGYRRLELLDAAFSADGSVLAVLTAQCVTVTIT
ncbi:quinon protein alcohol dehydrogenase-like superfamily [Pavlovales sp. CCMP2436]|nr:quinon protein alcohol dehydrogenase-like superfamily [Pavlovales sp. CCMP2436]